MNPAKRPEPIELGGLYRVRPVSKRSEVTAAKAKLRELGPDLPKPVLKDRICLTCDEPFRSVVNRICNWCSHRLDKMG